MTSFQQALDFVDQAVSGGGGAQPPLTLDDAFSFVDSAIAAEMPGATPGARDEDIQAIAAQEYAGMVDVVPDIDIGIMPREVARGAVGMFTQAAQAVATPGMRAQFIESVLSPMLMFQMPFLGSAVRRQVARGAARTVSQALEPAGSGLSVEDVETEAMAMRGAQAGLAAGQREGFRAEASRAVGQVVPQAAAVAGAVLTGQPVVAAALASNAVMPLMGFTSGQIAYMDELDQKRADEAAAGKPLSEFDIGEMGRRGAVTGAIAAGVEAVGAATGTRLVGKALAAAAKPATKNVAIARLAQAGQDKAARVLATRAGQAGAQAFARITAGTGQITNGFIGQAGKALALSAAEEGAEEFAEGMLNAPFTYAPMSEDLWNAVSAAAVGSVAGGVGGGIGVTGAVTQRALANRREAMRPETDKERILRQSHAEAIAKRVDWTKDLDDTQRAEIAVALDTLNGMDQEERGTFLQEMRDRQADAVNFIDMLLAERKQLDDAIAGLEVSERRMIEDQPRVEGERAAKQEAVREAEAAFTQAEADLAAAQEILAEAEGAAGVRPRVARPGRKIVTPEEARRNVESAQALVEEQRKNVTAALSQVEAAEGLEIDEGIRIDPVAMRADLLSDIAKNDAALKTAVTDKLIADARANAVAEKISDMPAVVEQKASGDVLSDLGTSMGQTFTQVKAPRKASKLTKDLSALGVNVVWFRSSGRFIPAFHSRKSRGTIYLNADMDPRTVRARAFEEMFHDIQMFQPDIAESYSELVGLAPIYRAGMEYVTSGGPESEQIGRLDVAAVEQLGAAGAALRGERAAIQPGVARAGAARLAQEGEANAFAEAAAAMTTNRVLAPISRFAARRGLMGREARAAMAVIDAAARSAAIAKVKGTQGDATLSPLARTLMWAEDLNVSYAREIEEADQPISRPVDVAEPAVAPIADVSLAREFPSRPLSSFTPEWRQWFDDSKVVDADVNPRVVYHATRAGRDFDVFKVTKDLGYHFASTPEAANRALGSRVGGVSQIGGARIYPVYLSIKNPLRVSETGSKMMGDLGGWNFNDLVGQFYRPVKLRESNLFRYEPEANEFDIPEGMSIPEAMRTGRVKRTESRPGLIDMTTLEYVQKINSEVRAEIGELTKSNRVRFNKAALQKFVADLKRLGYDGMVYKNIVEGGGDSWIAFDSNQIKSVFNERPTSAPGISMARASDEEYFAAIERGDMTAVQAMVDAAARAAGYLYDGYHASRVAFERFLSLAEQAEERGEEFDYDGYEGGNLGRGFYFTPDQSYAKRFGTPRKFYLKIDNIVDARKPEVLDRLRAIYNDLVEEQGGAKQGEAYDALVEEVGADGVIAADAGGFAYGADELLIKQSNQAKLADPIVRDADGNIIPLSKRFDVSRPEISFARASDADYFAAIERGDMTAVQRMVDAAAKAAGYIYRVFHGTNAPPFDVFDMEMGGTKTGADSAQIGLFASDNQKVAQSYADNIGMGGAIDLALGGPLSAMRDKALETGRGKELKNAYLAAKNEYDAAIKAGRERVRANVANSDVIARLKSAGFENQIDGFIERLSMAEIMNGDWLESDDIVAAESKLTEAQKPLSEFVNDVLVSSLPNRRVLNLYAKMDNPAIYDAEGKTPAEFSLTPKIKKAINDGHDGVIFKNLIDPVEPSTHYVVFKSSQFKSSDPIVRDEAGNIIPLSKRFDVSRPEISFAREDAADIEAMRTEIAALQRQMRDVQNVTAAQRARAMREVNLLQRRLVTAQLIAEQKIGQAERLRKRMEREREVSESSIADAQEAIGRLERDLDEAEAALRSEREKAKAGPGSAAAIRSAQRAIDFAYRIGRREGLVAGEVRGQQVGLRETAAAERRAERAERRVVTSAERIDELLGRIGEAKAEISDLRRNIRTDAALAQRAADLAYRMGLRSGQVQGMMRGRQQVLRVLRRREDAFAQQLENLRTLNAMRVQRTAEDIERRAALVRKIAVDAVNMLPVKIRGTLAERAAAAETISDANQIAIIATRNAVNNEISTALAVIKATRKKMNRRGMRNTTRQRVESMLDQADAMLRDVNNRKLAAKVVTGKKSGLGPGASVVTNAVSLYSAVLDASLLVEQAVAEVQADRDSYLREKAARSAAYAALETELMTNVTARPTLEQAARADMPPVMGAIAKIQRSASDIYTLMLEVESTETGAIGKMLNAAIRGKGESALEHARIIRDIDPALKLAGYENLADYSYRNGLLGQSVAQTMDVTLGGAVRTLPIGKILSVAAMDDETLSLMDGTQPITFRGVETTLKIMPTRKEIEDMLASLTPGQRGLIDAMKAILETRIRDRAMEAIWLVEGDMPPIVRNYWPRIRRVMLKDADSAEILRSAAAGIKYALTSVGFAQARVNSKDPLVYDDAFLTWDKHVRTSLDMIHMAQPYRDAMTVLSNEDIQIAIDSRMGTGTAEGLRAIFASGVGAVPPDTSTIIDFLTNNVTQALLIWNPRTIAKVYVGGTIRLMSEVSPGTWARGVARANALRTVPQWMERVSEIHSVNGYFAQRHGMTMRSILSGSLSENERANFSAAMVASADSLRAAGQSIAAAKMAEASRAVLESTTNATKALSAAIDAMRIADEQIMLVAVEARLAEVEDEGILTGTDALREASFRAEMDYRKTQNASDTFDETLFASMGRIRKDRKVMRLILPFASDPLKARNQIRRAYLSGEGRARTALAITGNMAASTIINAVSLPTLVAMTYLISNMIGGDDEENRDLPPEVRKALDKQLEQIPANVVQDVLSQVFGYVGMGMAEIVSIAMRNEQPSLLMFRPLVQTARVIAGPDDESVMLKAMKATLAMAQLLGIPAFQLYRFAEGLIPESQETSAERLRKKVERRTKALTPESVQERVRRRVEQLRRGG